MTRGFWPDVVGCDRAEGGDPKPLPPGETFFGVDRSGVQIDISASTGVADAIELFQVVMGRR